MNREKTTEGRKMNTAVQGIGVMMTGENHEV